MNYRHAYHAGNFADTFKHIILTALVQSFLQKEKGFCFLDTHAGIGLYDLKSTEALKNPEFESGILRILKQNNPPPLVQTYLSCVKNVNQQNHFQFYPGSPSIVKQFLRKQDRMVLCELHEEDYLKLRRCFPHDKQVGVHHQDGYLGLKAFLPPPERRGLILIDPPYEQEQELSTALTALTQALQRFETGVFALWYPIKHAHALMRFHQTLTNKINRHMLIAELSLYPEDTDTHLNGNGMVIINPPWKLQESLQQTLPSLWRALSPEGTGRYTIFTV